MEASCIDFARGADRVFELFERSELPIALASRSGLAGSMQRPRTPLIPSRFPHRYRVVLPLGTILP
jgi:hypothetical protein